MKGLRKGPVAAGLLLALSFTTAAHASFVLTLDDPTTSGIDVTVVDDGTGDTFAGLGTISYSGSVGAFNVNVTTGTSKPVSGTGILDLNSINVSSSTGGTLIVGLTDTDFAGTTYPYQSSFGGTTDGTVSFDFMYDTSNMQFGGSTLYSSGPLSGPSFSGSSVNGITPADPYSLTIFATIVHSSGSETTSFGAELAPVPLPAAAWLFGSGLLGLASCARRRRS